MAVGSHALFLLCICVALQPKGTGRKQDHGVAIRSFLTFDSHFSHLGFCICRSGTVMGHLIKGVIRYLYEGRTMNNSIYVYVGGQSRKSKKKIFARDDRE